MIVRNLAVTLAPSTPFRGPPPKITPLSTPPIGPRKLGTNSHTSRKLTPLYTPIYCGILPLRYTPIYCGILPLRYTQDTAPWFTPVEITFMKISSNFMYCVTCTTFITTKIIKNIYQFVRDSRKLFFMWRFPIKLIFFYNIP